ncbi:MAG: SirB2 family protein [Betaproteobacteria bacterium]
MLACYHEIKAVHVATVIASGVVFMLRGVLVQSGAQRFAMAPPLRYASYAIDTALLAAALMLVSILPRAAFANHWLTLKLVLLCAYVALGSVALKRGRGPRARAVAFVAALATYGAMVGIARAHHPLGWLRALAG